MDFSQEQVLALLTPPALPCVTVFATLEGRGVAGEHDRRRVKSLLDEADGSLQSWGLRPADAARLLRPARQMLDDEPAWPSEWQGLAVYVADGLTRRFGLHAPVTDGVLTAERFLVAPLIREVERIDRFWLLALSRNQPRLLQGNVSRLWPVRRHLPTFEEVVGGEEAEAALQHHQGSGGTARAAATYHGHGGSKDADEDRLRRWIAVVAERVEELVDGEHAPLVLAGVAEELAAFRQATSHPHVLATALLGSPDRRSETDLHAQAWPLVAEQQSVGSQVDLDRFAELHGTGRTLTDTTMVARAAQEGRIDVLFATATPASEDAPTVDASVVGVWTTGGTLHIVDGPAPGDGPLAAILRYVPTPHVQADRRPVDA